MKILHISTMDYSGAGTAAFRLHLGLKSLGFNSKMLVLNRKSQDSDVVKFEEQSNSIFKKIRNTICSKLISLELASHEHTRLKDADLFSNSRTLHKISKHPLIKEADIINLHWIAWMIDYNEFFSKVPNKPIVWTLHDMNPFTGGCHYSGGCTKYQTGCSACPQLGSKDSNDLSRKIFEKKEKAYKNKNIHVLTPSKWLAGCAKKSILFKNFPIDVIPNGLAHDIFKKQDKRLLRDQLKLLQDKTLILFGIDYKVERKGLGYLLEALKFLKQRLDPSQIALVIIGPKQNLDTFSKDTKYLIYQLGYTKDQTLLPSIYSSCDMFALPSLEDNLPNTMLESMSCGTPVVGFKTGGIPDMITPHKTGLLAELKNTQDLAQKIECMIAHPKEREEMGKNARKLVEQECTLEHQAKRYLKLYEMILKR